MKKRRTWWTVAVSAASLERGAPVDTIAWKRSVLAHTRDGALVAVGASLAMLWWRVKDPTILIMSVFCGQGDAWRRDPAAVNRAGERVR